MLNVPGGNQMENPMAEKVALITGGSQGIGRATAKAFVREGASVVIVSRTRGKGEQVVKEIFKSGGQALWLGIDVSDAGQVRDMIDQVLNRFGRLDAAVNNGGSGGVGELIPEIEEAEWDKTVNGYLKSVWLCMKYEIPAILESGGGAIVNVSSVDGHRAFPWNPVYAAAKHGVIGLTKSAAVQYADKGLRINAVSPGWTDTNPVRRTIKQLPEGEQEILSHQPMGRLGTPAEVAEAILWLCSDKASFVTGATLAVDGGYLAY